MNLESHSTELDDGSQDLIPDIDDTLYPVHNPVNAVIVIESDSDDSDVTLPPSPFPLQASPVSDRKKFKSQFKYKYLHDIGVSQVERKNFDHRQAYFGSTNRNGGKHRRKISIQILEREN